MGAIASQISSLTIVYSTVYSDADQRKHQSSASLAFVRGIHRGPVNSPHKWPVTRKMFPFNDVIMQLNCLFWSIDICGNNGADISKSHVLIRRQGLSLGIRVNCEQTLKEETNQYFALSQDGGEHAENFKGNVFSRNILILTGFQSLIFLSDSGGDKPSKV